MADWTHRGRAELQHVRSSCFNIRGSLAYDASFRRIRQAVVASLMLPAVAFGQAHASRGITRSCKVLGDTESISYATIVS